MAKFTRAVLRSPRQRGSPDQPPSRSGVSKASSTVAWAVALLVMMPAPGGAHDLGTTIAQVTLGRDHFEILLECDLDALALGAGPGADNAALTAELGAMDATQLTATTANLRQLFTRRVRLLADGTPIPFDVEFPDRTAGRTLDMDPPTFLGLTARLRGSIPADAGPLRLRLSRAFPAAQLTVLDAAGEHLLSELVPRGEDSSEFGAGVLSDAVDGAGFGSDPGLASSNGHRSGLTYALIAALAALALGVSWRAWRGTTDAPRDGPAL